MDDNFSFREAATWAISCLAIIVSALSRKLWTDNEQRMADFEAVHKQHAHDLTAHVVGDAASHDKIKSDLASSLDRLDRKIDDKTDALAAQITHQHGMLAGRIDKVLELFVEGKK